MRVLYREIFLSTAKYVILRNIFMFITGIINIFIVKLLGPYEYGRYFLVWNLISTVGPILSLGWLNTLARFIPEKYSDYEKAQLLSQGLISVFIISILFFLGVSLTYKFSSQFLPKELKDIIFIFICFTILVAFFNVLEGFWRGLGKFNEFVVIDGLRSNIGNILALVLLLLGFISYKIIIQINFLVGVFFLCGLFYHIRKYLNFRIISIEKKVIIFCLSLLLGQIVYMLAVNLDLILLRGMLKDPYQVGYFSAGTRIPKIIEAVFIGQLPAPILYYLSISNNDSFREKFLNFSTKILGFVFGLVSLLCFSLSDYIIEFLFSEKYIHSIIVFKFFSLSLPILAFLIFISTYYVYNKKVFVHLAFYFLFLVLFHSLFTYLLLPLYKFFAPVISYLFCLVFFGILINMDCMYRFKISVFFEFIRLIFFLVLSVSLEIIFKIRLISTFTFIIIYILTKSISFDEINKLKEITISFLKKNQMQI